LGITILLILKKISEKIITFGVENVVNLININSSNKGNEPIGFNIGDLDLDNIYKFDLSYGYSVAHHLSIQYNKDIFGIMLWDIHDKVMPKSSIWVERLIIKGDIDLDGIIG
jgi:hypothetical protein